MFLICFRLRSTGPLDLSLLCDPKRHLRPLSGDMASCWPQAFVHFLLRQVFRSHVGWIVDSRHFHDGQLTACHRLLYPQDLGMEMSHAPLRALRQSPSTQWRPHAHVCFTTFAIVSRQLRPEFSMHSWSTRKTPLHLSLSPPHFELLPTLQGDTQQAPRTKTKSTVGSSHTLPSPCL